MMVYATFMMRRIRKMMSDVRVLKRYERVLIEGFGLM
jgi:hypothetical protein